MAVTNLQREVFRKLPDYTGQLNDNYKLTSVSGSQEDPRYLSLGRLKAFIAGGAQTIELTYVQAQSQIASKILIAGAVYKITDATQAQTGGKGAVYLIAIENDTFSSDAIWQITTDFKGFGWVDMVGTMVATDPVTTVSVNGVNLLSSNVLFTTDYETLATDVAANINANAASDYTAFAIKNRVIIQNKNTGAASNGFPVGASGTNLTPQNILAISNGQQDRTLYLEASYDFTQNHIYKAYYLDNNVTYSVSNIQISSLGYNPIYYFPFGDQNSFNGGNRDTFENSTFHGQSFRNVWYSQCLFNDCVFESGLNWDVTNGAALSVFFVEFGHFIRGTINFSGTIMSYTGGASRFNASRMLFFNDSNITCSNCNLGGNGIFLGRYFNDCGLDLSNGTIYPTQNCTLDGERLVRYNMTSQSSFTGAFQIKANQMFTVNATGVNGTPSIVITNANNCDSTIDLTNTVIANFVNITSKVTNSTWSFTGASFNQINSSSSDFNKFDLIATANYAGFNLNFNNSIIVNNFLNIPVVTRDFHMDNVQWINSDFNFENTITLDGTANNGAVGTFPILNYVPENYFSDTCITDGVNFVGTGVIQIGITGATSSLLPTTLGTLLNSPLESTPVITIKAPGPNITALEGEVTVAAIGTVPSPVTLRVWGEGKIGV